MERRWYLLQDRDGFTEILPFEKFHPAVGSILPAPENRAEQQHLLGEWEVMAAFDPDDFPFLEHAVAQDKLYNPDEHRVMRFLRSLARTSIYGGIMKAQRKGEKASATS
jgi:hypothetical protein